MPKGVTLIELIIVLIVVGIIAVTAVPRIIDIDQRRQEAALNKIKSDLRYVKEFAINNTCRTRVSFNASSDSYTATTNISGSWAGMTNPTTNTTPFTVEFNSGIYKGVEIVSANFAGQNAVEFDSLGRPYSYDGVLNSSNLLAADGTVALTGENTITVTAVTGRIY